MSKINIFKKKRINVDNKRFIPIEEEKINFEKEFPVLNDIKINKGEKSKFSYKDALNRKDKHKEVFDKMSISDTKKSIFNEDKNMLNYHNFFCANYLDKSCFDIDELNIGDSDEDEEGSIFEYYQLNEYEE